MFFTEILVLLIIKYFVVCKYLNLPEVIIQVVKITLKFKFLKNFPKLYRFLPNHLYRLLLVKQACVSLKT